MLILAPLVCKMDDSDEPRPEAKTEDLGSSNDKFEREISAIKKNLKDLGAFVYSQQDIIESLNRNYGLIQELTINNASGVDLLSVNMQNMVDSLNSLSASVQNLVTSHHSLINTVNSHNDKIEFLVEYVKSVTNA